LPSSSSSSSPISKREENYLFNSRKSFNERRCLLREQLNRMHIPEPENYREKPKIKMFVNRETILEDSFKVLMTLKPDYLKLRLWVQFNSEQGVDYGGLTREWYHLLMQQITNPNYCLFTPSSTNSYVYQINPLSYINQDHLQYFRFTGRVIGKALFDDQLITTYFTPIFYKQLLDIPLTLRDLEFFDNEFYRSLVYLQENECVEKLNLFFTVTQEEFDVHSEVELCEGGANMLVTDENKERYINLMVNYKLCRNTAEQMNSVKRGFNDLIPHDVLSTIQFSGPELELLICGIKKIDSLDWQRNTDYGGYNASSPQVVWFWDVVHNMTNEERSRLLQFVTGTTKLPVGGFAHLVGSTGPRKFQIIRNLKGRKYLPTAHTYEGGEEDE
jgi:hypothetical protein